MTNDQLAASPKWVQDDINDCKECRKYDGIIWLCGWHENLAVAVVAVEKTADLLDGDR